LTYKGAQPLLEGPPERRWWARLRAFLIFLGGCASFSLIQAFLGRAIAVAAVAVVALVLIAWHLFSPAPAYKIADRESPTAGSKP
jgi:hypothetical protein